MGPPEEAGRIQKMLGRDVLGACFTVSLVERGLERCRLTLFPLPSPHACSMPMQRRRALSRSQRLRTARLHRQPLLKAFWLRSRIVTIVELTLLLWDECR